MIDYKNLLLGLLIGGILGIVGTYLAVVERITKLELKLSSIDKKKESPKIDMSKSIKITDKNIIVSVDAYHAVIDINGENKSIMSLKVTDDSPGMEDKEYRESFYDNKNMMRFTVPLYYISLINKGEKSFFLKHFGIQFNDKDKSLYFLSGKIPDNNEIKPGMKIRSPFYLESATKEVFYSGIRNVQAEDSLGNKYYASAKDIRETEKYIKKYFDIKVIESNWSNLEKLDSKRYDLLISKAYEGIKAN